MFLDVLKEILNNPWNFVAFLGALLLLITIFIVFGLELKIRGITIVPGRDGQGEREKLPHAFQEQMVEDLRASYERRFEAISGLDYHESLNWENDFLKRVSALYSGADKVYAVTLSSISDFWISESDRQLILQYLKCQEGIEIHRLFVFESPYDLKRYEEVLQANCLAYGNVGGVYVTSSRNYQANVLARVARQSSRYRFLDRDFGIWQSSVAVLATLQGTHLSFNKLERNIEEIDVAAFRGIFSNPPEGIFRWDAGSAVGEIASKIFPEDITYVGPVTHLVFLDHQESQVLDELAAQAIELDRIQQNAISEGIPINFTSNETWWGVNLQRTDGRITFNDGKFLGRLNCDDQFKYLLMIQLPSISDLREWYRLEDHSEIRRTIYEELVDKTKSIYRKLEDSNEVVVEDFNEIEELVSGSGRFRRMDFIYNKHLEDIDPFRIYQDYVSLP